MVQWEVCRIKHVSRKVRGFLESYYMEQDVAVLDTANGEQVVDQTAEFSNTQAERVKLLEERAKLVGRLLATGWEPINSEKGLVTVFRRQVP